MTQTKKESRNKGWMRMHTQRMAQQGQVLVISGGFVFVVEEVMSSGNKGKKRRWESERARRVGNGYSMYLSAQGRRGQRSSGPGEEGEGHGVGRACAVWPVPCACACVSYRPRSG